MVVLSFRVAVAMDAVSFFLNISRADETVPVYDISLLLTIFHPLEGVLNATFDPLETISISQSTNETETVLNLTQLSYTVVDPMDSSVTMVDRSRLPLVFLGVLSSEAYTSGSIQLYGSIQYQSSPSNGHVYVEPITFPRIFIRNAEFAFYLVSTSLLMTEDNLVVLRETAVWRANITRVSGPSANLTLLVELNDTFLNIADVEIQQIG